MKNIVIGVSLFIISLVAGAGTHADFNEKTFKVAQANGKTIVLEFHKEGCGHCKKQVEVIDEISQSDTFKNVTFLRIDFDEQKDLNKRFKVTSKSTLVVLKDGNEIARAIGITSKNAISHLVSKGIN